MYRPIKLEIIDTDDGGFKVIDLENNEYQLATVFEFNPINTDLPIKETKEFVQYLINNYEYPYNYNKSFKPDIMEHQQLLFDKLHDLTEHDWNHMHDCIFHVTKNSTSKDDMIKIFNEMPGDMKFDAFEWGMNDTLWRDNFIDWYKENKLK